jgi:hypothetical protein
MGRAVNSFSEWAKSAYTFGGRKTPEERLFTAVLSQAVHDATSTHVPKLDREAAQHFLTHNSSDLNTICEGAGFDPAYLIRKVQECTSTDRGWNLKVPSAAYHHKSGKKRGPKQLTAAKAKKDEHP